MLKKKFTQDESVDMLR